MARSLLVKLLGAFALLIVVTALLVSYIASRATAGEFRLYMDRSGRLWAQRLAPQLADYYARTGGWRGVEAVLDSPMGAAMMGPGGMMGGPGMMGGQGSSQPAAAEGAWDMWAMMGQRLVIADAGGRVIVDSAGSLLGQELPPSATAEGVPVVAGSARVGTLVVAPLSTANSASPAGDFLPAVNRAILLASLLAGAVAILLGGWLFYHLTAPIRQLTAAAHAVAGGDLSRRVVVGSQDELGQLGQAFNSMAASLAQAEEQRRQMVADVAHELRTPLSVLQANLEAIQDGVLPLDAEQVASLHQETLLLNRLVADLRLLSTAEAGQLTLERQPLQPSQILQQAAERLGPEADEKGISLEFSASQGLPSVLADAGRLQQVIANLVTNAIRYTPACGTVRLEARMAVPDDLAEAGAGVAGAAAGYVVFAVTDDGQGIPTADLPHVFDRFYRADRSRARASGGSGLGLAIVKYLIEAHGGRVWAESPVEDPSGEMGGGTRVSFLLPAGGPG